MRGTLDKQGKPWRGSLLPRGSVGAGEACDLLTLIFRSGLNWLWKDRSLVALDSSYTAPTQLLHSSYGRTRVRALAIKCIDDCSLLRQVDVMDPLDGSIRAKRFNRFAQILDHFWRALLRAGQVKVSAAAVSYTHLTLPTIYSV